MKIKAIKVKAHTRVIGTDQAGMKAAIEKAAEWTKRTRVRPPDRLVEGLNHELDRRNFGYPEHMTTDEVLAYAEVAVAEMLVRPGARAVDKARFAALFGYSTDWLE